MRWPIPGRSILLLEKSTAAWPARRNEPVCARPRCKPLELSMFALLIPLVLKLAPQLAGLIFGSKGADATEKVAAVVQTVVGDVADLKAPGGVAAAVAHIQSNPQASSDLAAQLATLQIQMQKEQDDAAEAVRQDALDELKARLADTTSARDMATQLAQAHSGLAYGGVVVSVVIVAAFGWTTYSVLNS